MRSDLSQGSHMPGHFISCLHGQTLWHSLVGDVILLPLHIPARTERQDPLSVCFLNLGNSRILLPCNTQAVSFIKSCPGKCFIHSCSRPTVGKARAFKTLGAGRQWWSAWQQLPSCFSNIHERQGEDKTLQLFTCLWSKRVFCLQYRCQILRT